MPCPRQCDAHCAGMDTLWYGSDVHSWQPHVVDMDLGTLGLNTPDRLLQEIRTGGP